MLHCSCTTLCNVHFCAGGKNRETSGGRQGFEEFTVIRRNYKKNMLGISGLNTKKGFCQTKQNEIQPQTLSK